MSARVEFVAYPPTGFPVRDLLVLEQIPIGPSDVACEIGVGSGATTARLARLCRRVVGFDISTATLDALRYLEARHPNLDLVAADLTDPEAISRFAGAFTRVVSCDTLEHVSDPRAFFHSLERLLAPGGEFLVTFPNEPQARMHGITRFDTVGGLEALLQEAGLTGHCIGAARLRPRAGRLAENLGWRPLRALRRLLRGRPAPVAAPPDAPQRFEETHFFKQMAVWRPLAPAVNLYWYVVLRLMARTGHCFEIDWNFRASSFTDCQVLVKGRKPAAEAGRTGATAAA